MEKRDFKKELKELYQAPSNEIVQVTVPSLNFIQVDGQGDPNTAQEYAEAIESLFSLAYAIKFMIKKGPLACDYGVMPLEGLWWADDMTTFSVDDKSNWKWTMMIMQPPMVTKEIFTAARSEVEKKKKLPALAKLRFAEFVEGKCAQIMHIGPFSAEGPTIARMHQYIDSRSKRRGKHHEIYLSDIRKADPSKWKTILRQPME